jgi:hypothetical protein
MDSRVTGDLLIWTTYSQGVIDVVIAPRSRDQGRLNDETLITTSPISEWLQWR